VRTPTSLAIERPSVATKRPRASQPSATCCTRGRGWRQQATTYALSRVRSRTSWRVPGPNRFFSPKAYASSSRVRESKSKSGSPSPAASAPMRPRSVLAVPQASKFRSLKSPVYAGIRPTGVVEGGGRSREGTEWATGTNSMSEGPQFFLSSRRRYRNELGLRSSRRLPRSGLRPGPRGWTFRKP